MFEQRLSHRTPAQPPAAWTDEAVILDWIAAWQPVREDVVRLIEQYKADSGHDVSRFTPLLDEVDGAIRLLEHRVHWLRCYLGRVAEEPIDKP